MTHEEPVQRGVRYRQPRPGQLDTQFNQRDVLRRLPGRHLVAVPFDTPRTRVATLWLGSIIACHTAFRMPLERRRRRDLKGAAAWC